MQLVIHNNLLDVAKSSKTNFSLKRDLPGILAKACVAGTIIALPMEFFIGTSGNGFINNFSYVAGAVAGFSVFFNCCGFNSSKNEANSLLNTVSSNLHHLNIYADANDLKHVYSVKKEYSRDVSNSRIIETDYIMIPKEYNSRNCCSRLIQRHVVGSNDYILSEPTIEQAKVFALHKNR